MKNNELHDRRLQATPRGIGVMCNFYADKAENATVWDVEGNEYIDFAAGIAVLNTGHRHPNIISAIEKQLHAFTPYGLPDCAVRRLCVACRTPQRTRAN